jgi:hypothetical protein
MLIAPFFIWGIWSDAEGNIRYLGNFTDIPFHMAMVSSFVFQDVFPPDFPQAAGSKMCYHFLINFHTAMLVETEEYLFPALIFDQAILGICLALMLSEFYRSMSDSDKIVSALAVGLFVLAHNGVFNLIAALSDIPIGGKTLDVAHGIGYRQFHDILLFPFFNFLFPMMNYFMPQRPFLFGFSVACLIYCVLLKASEKEGLKSRLIVFAVGCTAAMPLFHFHSFLVMATTIMILGAFKLANPRLTLLCYLGLLPALPQIMFLLSQPMAENASGWDVSTIPALKEVSFLGSTFITRFIFWCRAGGLTFPIGMAAFFYFVWKGRDDKWPSREMIIWMIISCLLFFVLINLYRMTPSWGDSNKFYLFLHLFLCLFIARACVIFWKMGPGAKVGTLVFLALAGFVPSAMTYWDFWAPRVNYAFTGKSDQAQLMFWSDELACARWIMDNTPSDAVFLASDQVIHFLPALTGRRVVDGAYTATNGLERPGVKREVPTIYSTGSEELARKWGVDYILVSRRETSRYRVNLEALDHNFTCVKPEDIDHCTLYRVGEEEE